MLNSASVLKNPPPITVPFDPLPALWLATKDNRDAIKNVAGRWRSHLQWQRKIQFHSHEGKAKPMEF